MPYGQIVEGQILGPKSVPKSFENISGFDLLSDEQLAEFGWHPWKDEIDTSSGNDVIYTKSKDLIDGFIVETTYMRFFNQDELSANRDSLAIQVRNIRDYKLAKSDYTQMSDYSISNKLDWATYRQALRDLPTQLGFPELIEWPVAPS